MSLELADGSGMQGPGRRGLFLDFSGYFAPNFFAVQVTALPKLFRALSDFFVGVETVMSPAKSRIHHNGVFMRRPHDNPPNTRKDGSLNGASQRRQVASQNFDNESTVEDIHIFSVRYYGGA